MTFPTLAAATQWLAGQAVDGIPLRLHDRSAGDDGAPHLAHAFWRWVTRDDPAAW